jgi:hypothetical protein
MDDETQGQHKINDIKLKSPNLNTKLYHLRCIGGFHVQDRYDREANICKNLIQWRGEAVFILSSIM